MTQPTPPCPLWCESTHTAGWPQLHHAEVGRIELGPGMAIEVDLGIYRGDDDAPRIGLNLTDEDDGNAGRNLTIHEARQLWLLLGEALEALGEGMPERGIDRARVSAWLQAEATRYGAANEFASAETLRKLAIFADRTDFDIDFYTRESLDVAKKLGAATDEGQPATGRAHVDPTTT